MNNKGGIMKGALAAIRSMVGWTTIRMGADHIADMWQSVSPFRKRACVVETFEQACVRLGADETRIAKNARVLAVMRDLFAGFALFGGAMVVVTLSQGARGGFAWIGFTALTASIAFRHGFRAWQLNRRKLGGFDEFVRFGRVG